MFWTILVIIALVILLFMMRRRAAYKRLFADAHFLEIAEGVRHLKAAALARMEKSEQKSAPPDNPNNDPRVLITSQNLCVFYTISEGEESFDHHFSLGIAKGYTATPVGETFSLYLAHLLAFASQHFTIERSQNGIYHVEWQLTPETQETFARTPVKIPERAELPAIYERLEKWRGEISIQQTEISLPG